MKDDTINFPPKRGQGKRGKDKKPRKRTPKAIESKWCKGCDTVKSIGDFYLKRPGRQPEEGRSYARHLCKKCWMAKNIPYMRLSHARYPEKDKARSLANAAMRRGELVKRPCAKCSDENSFGHHWDYTKPLDVIWLCRQHHEDIHHGRLKLEEVK